MQRYKFLELKPTANPTSAETPSWDGREPQLVKQSGHKGTNIADEEANAECDLHNARVQQGRNRTNANVRKPESERPTD